MTSDMDLQKSFTRPTCWQRVTCFELAINRINKVKDQREYVNVEDEDDISIDDPDSQESRIVELLECKETLRDLKQLHVNAKSKLRKYVSSGQEN